MQSSHKPHEDKPSHQDDHPPQPVTPLAAATVTPPKSAVASPLSSVDAIRSAAAKKVEEIEKELEEDLENMRLDETVDPSVSNFENMRLNKTVDPSVSNFEICNWMKLLIHQKVIFKYATR